VGTKLPGNGKKRAKKKNIQQVRETRSKKDVKRQPRENTSKEKRKKNQEKK